MSAAQAAVQSLRARGVTQATIAAALGRDPSYVSQIARGVTPGHKVAGALGDLARGRATTPPASRGGGDVPTAVAITRSGGLVADTAGRGGVRTIVSNVARAGGRVTATITYTSGRTVHLSPRGGYDAQKLRAQIDKAIREAGYDPRGRVPADVRAAAVWDALVEWAAQWGYDLNEIGTAESVQMASLE